MSGPGADLIAPWLLVGGAIEPLANLPLWGVVDLREEACDDAHALGKAGLAFLALPTPDHHAPTQPMLDAGVAFVRAGRSAGGRVLIHCQHGIGRSVLLALCALVEAGVSPDKAMRHVKDRREAASPSLAQYRAWAAWLARRGLAAPHFDDFAAVAYRHLHRT